MCDSALSMLHKRLSVPLGKTSLLSAATLTLRYRLAHARAQLMPPQQTYLVAVGEGGEGGEEGCEGGPHTIHVRTVKSQSLQGTRSWREW